MKNNLSVVIISDARINYSVTLACIQSLINQNLYEIIVVESDPKVQYEGCINIHPSEKFNYNKYLNIGASVASGYYIAFCNNDLIFTYGWWSRLYNSMVKHGVQSASPICPNTHKEFGYQVSDTVIHGTKIREIVAGWCLVLDRLWYLRMGKFDERFEFWCADNSYGKQLEMHNKNHILDCNSVVHHLGSSSLDKIDDVLKENYTMKQVEKFNKEFKENLFNCSNNE